MAPLWLLTVAAGAVTAVSAPLTARIAQRIGLLDRPGPLKVQSSPVPYLGGAAVFCGVAVALVGSGHLPLVLPLALALALGVADDRAGLPVTFRLVAQAAVGALLGLAVDSALPRVVLVPVAVAVTIALINAVNLIDGLDALATSVTGVAALGLGLILDGAGQVPAFATAAAAAGFLVHNRPPARQYLGDGGAYLLGTALSAGVLSATAEGQAPSALLVTPLLLAYPIAEVATTIVRRRRAGLPWSAGDRGHAYDRLVAKGMGVQRVVLTIVVLQASATAAGVILAGSPRWVAALGLVAASVITASLVHRAGLLTPDLRRD